MRPVVCALLLAAAAACAPRSVQLEDAREPDNAPSAKDTLPDVPHKLTKYKKPPAERKLFVVKSQCAGGHVQFYELDLLKAEPKRAGARHDDASIYY